MRILNNEIKFIDFIPILNLDGHIGQGIIHAQSDILQIRRCPVIAATVQDLSQCKRLENIRAIINVKSQ